MRQRSAVGYIRVSSQQQTRGSSLEHQRSSITRWCQEQQIDLVTVCDNDGRHESGKDLHRDGLEQVDALVSSGAVDMVVVTKIEPASLADDSQPPEQLAAAREAAMRTELEQVWRANQLQRTIIEARDRRVVRMAAEID